MIDTMFYINVADLMGINKPLPKPRLKCTLHDSRAETLKELGIINITGKDADYGMVIAPTNITDKCRRQKE